jgi:lysophospholipase L1-like esterase
MFRILFILIFISGGAMADTLMIGDSIFALTKKIPNNLENAGIKFVLRAESMAKVDEITQQYRAYRDEIGVPEIVIMNGGGNDIIGNEDMIGDCYKRTQRCIDYVHEINRKGSEAILEMHSDGVARIVYVGIHYLNYFATPLNPLVDIGMDEFKQICDLAPIRCDFVDPRPSFKGATDLHVKDGIHLNDKGAKVISDLIIDIF